MASWSRDSVIKFIELYKSYECLWRIKSKEYSNRIVKDKAYVEMVFVKEIDSSANRCFNFNWIYKVHRINRCFLVGAIVSSSQLRKKIA